MFEYDTVLCNWRVFYVKAIAKMFSIHLEIPIKRYVWFGSSLILKPYSCFLVLLPFRAWLWDGSDHTVNRIASRLEDLSGLDLIYPSGEPLQVSYNTQALATGLKFPPKSRRDI